jgi:hypothetical protein
MRESWPDTEYRRAIGGDGAPEARSFTLSLLSWPQAAMMSRPRGVRTGEA